MSGSLRLHADVHDGTGPFALLVHGMLSSRSQWLPNLDALRTVCRPVVVELWGHGRSPAPDDAAPYAPGGYVDAFEAIREQLGVERWLVIGQSLGAALTLGYALDRPDRVIAQVFTNSSSALADEEWQARMRAGAPAIARRVEEGGLAAIEAMPIHPRHARRMPAGVRDALLSDAELIRPEGVARAMLHTVPASSVRSRVVANTVPTLLVAGTRERDFAEPRAFAGATMPCLDVVEADAGHAVNVQAQATFDEAVVAFFRRHG